MYDELILFFRREGIIVHVSLENLLFSSLSLDTELGPGQNATLKSPESNDESTDFEVECCEAT